MKKVLAVVLAISMLLGMVSVAGAEGDKVKLTAVFISHPLTQSVYDMEWLMALEEAAGVDVEWEQIYTDWNQVKSTRFASGDIPDLLFSATGDSDYTTYDGLFMELTDLIDQYAPNVKAMFEEEPDTLALAKTAEGKIYATPKFQGKWPDCNGVMFINKTWLDNLGLAAPTTLSELKNVLIAFRDNDANGNGNPSDEVPMDFNGWFGSAYSLSNLIGSWGIQLVNWGSDGYFAEDGVIKNFAVDERYKAMMTYLADLYAEGLINPNAITNDYSMFQSLSRGDADGNALVGVVYGWEETDKFGPTLYSQYVPVGPFTDDVDELATSEPRWTYDFSGLNMSSNRVAMSAKCANPEAAMKFIDMFYEPEHSVESLFGGILDGNLEKVADNHYKVLDPPEEAHTDNGTWKWTSTFADNGPMYIRRATIIDMAKDMAFALEEREQYKEAIARINMDTEYYPQFLMKYSVEDQNTLAQLQVGVTSVTDGWWGLWLTGEADINDTWDDYVAEVNANGLEQILAIRQAAYDAWKAQ
ncbi:MAG: extracellular solute-binding protein [Clostridia bacterium]|nr:extracellular solute-binding protein [Clostridia bacterium]